MLTKSIIILSAWLGLVCFATAQQPDVCIKADGMCKNGSFGEAQALLLESLSQTDDTPEERAAKFEAIALFYQDLVGNEALAFIYWRKLQGLTIPRDHPLRAQANQRIEQIEANRKRFHEQDQLLRMAGVATKNADERFERMLVLRRIIEEAPDYPQLAKAHFMLGRHLADGEKFSDALDHFKAAVALKPAIGRTLPITPEIKQARAEYIRRVVPGTGNVLLLLVGCIGVFLFWRYKPWKDLDRRHVFVGAGMIAGWCIAFSLLAYWMTHRSLGEPQSFAKPVMLRKDLTDEGNEVWIMLFFCGLAMTSILFLLSLATARFKKPLARFGMNMTLALMLSSALTSRIYILYLFKNTEYVTAEDQAEWQGAFFSLVRLNKYELPDTLEDLLYMLENANDRQKKLILEKHIDDWKSGFHGEQSLMERLEKD